MLIPSLRGEMVLSGNLCSQMSSKQRGVRFYSGDDPYWEAVDMHYWVRFIRLVPDDYS